MIPLGFRACPVLMLSFLSSPCFISFSSFYYFFFPLSLIFPYSFYPLLLIFIRSFFLPAVISSSPLFFLVSPFGLSHSGEAEPAGRQTGNMKGALGTLRTFGAPRVKGPCLFWVFLAVTISRIQEWPDIYALCTLFPLRFAQFKSSSFKNSLSLASFSCLSPIPTALFPGNISYIKQGDCYLTPCSQYKISAEEVVNI